MANSFNHGPGKAATTETVTVNANGTADTLHVIGPARDKSLYGGQVGGRYIREIAGANGTWRWVEDFRLAANATVPTGFTAV